MTQRRAFAYLKLDTTHSRDCRACLPFAPGEVIGEHGPQDCSVCIGTGRVPTDRFGHEIAWPIEVTA